MRSSKCNRADGATIASLCPDLLILKSESDDAVKSAALEAFLGIDQIVLRRTNTTPLKAKGASYRRFRSELKLDRAWVDEMLTARYTRHFYDEAERDAFRREALELGQME